MLMPHSIQSKYKKNGFIHNLLVMDVSISCHTQTVNLPTELRSRVLFCPCPYMIKRSR